MKIDGLPPGYRMREFTITVIETPTGTTLDLSEITPEGKEHLATSHLETTALPSRPTLALSA